MNFLPQVQSTFFLLCWWRLLLSHNPTKTHNTQVRQSFAMSLRNLGTDYIDSLVLHSPLRSHEQSMQGEEDRLVCAGACEVQRLKI